MALPTPSIDQMFSDPSLTPADKVRLKEEFLGKLESTPEVFIGRGQPLPHQMGEAAQGIDFAAASQPRTAMAAITKALGSPDLAKGLGADGVASITAALAQLQVPELVKDLSLTSPLSTGYVAYDLDAPAKMLTPKPTPLRNRIPRRRGMGLSKRYKRITGFTGTGTGGVGVFHPGISDTTQTNFANPSSSNSLYYNRGPKITYAGDESSVLYVQSGVSDELSWSTQFSGQGFQDMRALSRNATMWAHMLMKERELLYGRGTLTGYAGLLSAPTTVAGSARTADATESAITGMTTNIYVKVAALLGDFGVSKTSTASSGIGVSAGQVVDLTFVLPAGATGAILFISTGAADPGDASRFQYTFTGASKTNGLTYSGVAVSQKITIQGALPTTGNVPTAWVSPATGATINLTSTDGGSAFAAGHDGVWTYASSSNAGYVKHLDGQFSTTNPGTEYQTAFAQLYEAVKADPDRILFNGADRKQMSDAIKGSSNSNYQIKLQQDEVTGFTLGTVATAIVNEITGKRVEMEVHPWLPKGNSPILSDSLPIPDSNTDSVFAVYAVQELMGIDWPVNQFSYDTSTYEYGTLVCFAPAWLGAITGIQTL